MLVSYSVRRTSKDACTRIIHIIESRGQNLKRECRRTKMIIINITLLYIIYDTAQTTTTPGPGAHEKTRRIATASPRPPASGALGHRSPLTAGERHAAAADFPAVDITTPPSPHPPHASTVKPFFVRPSQPVFSSPRTQVRTWNSPVADAF